MKPNVHINFTRGVVVGTLVFSMFFLVWHVVLLKTGEIDIDRVIQRQANNSSVLFSSGINQNAFSYKVKLMLNANPEVLAIGSSRAMQLRQDFFKNRFINMGGTVSNIANLEQLSKELQALENKPELVLLLIDPWWFNPHHPAAKRSHFSSEFPDIVNTDLIFNAVKSLKRGNWLSDMLSSNNLGIHSILTGEGFSFDGSYHYTSTITSQRLASDIHFSNTLKRIENSTQRFEKASRADQLLIRRACSVIGEIEGATTQFVVIAPPFSKKVWAEMSEGGYHYIQDAYSQLNSCINNTLYDFSNPDTLAGSDDCEFVDGFHGGDTTAARMLVEVSTQDPILHGYIDEFFVTKFIEEFSGHAAGITTSLIGNKVETDFLKLGCHKQAHI